MAQIHRPTDKQTNRRTVQTDSVTMSLKWPNYCRAMVFQDLYLRCSKDAVRIQTDQIFIFMLRSLGFRPYNKIRLGKELGIINDFYSLRRSFLHFLPLPGWPFQYYLLCQLYVVHYCFNPVQLPCHSSSDLYKAVFEIKSWTLKPHKHLHTQGKILRNQPVSLTRRSIQEQDAPLKKKHSHQEIATVADGWNSCKWLCNYFLSDIGTLGLG